MLHNVSKKALLPVSRHFESRHNLIYIASNDVIDNNSSSNSSIFVWILFQKKKFIKVFFFKKIDIYLQNDDKALDQLAMHLTTPPFQFVTPDIKRLEVNYCFFQKNCFFIKRFTK